MSENTKRHSRQLWTPNTEENDNINYVFNNDKSSCDSSPKQDFLYDLWTMLENIQDEIYDQESAEFQVLEILNEVLYDTWSGSRRQL